MDFVTRIFLQVTALKNMCVFPGFKASRLKSTLSSIFSALNSFKKAKNNIKLFDGKQFLKFGFYYFEMIRMTPNQESVCVFNG